MELITTCPSIKLNDGNEIPILGLGTWKSKPDAVKNAVIDAVKAGYRYIDCACVYRNENEVGEALTELFDSGVVRRKDLFIVSKLWNSFHSPHLVKPALLDTLQRLELDYLDLYLIHWPMGYAEGHVMGLFPTDSNNKIIYSDVDYVDTWKGMEECKRLGLTRSIGISNFNHHQIERILGSCKIPPAMNQIENHPYLTQPELVDYCKSKGIAITAYSPLGSADRRWATKEDPILMDDPKIKAIAKKYNKSPAHILIRFHIDRGIVVIPKSVTKERILANWNVFDFELAPEDINVLESLEHKHRYCPLDWTKDHVHYPFTLTD